METQMSEHKMIGLDPKLDISHLDIKILSILEDASGYWMDIHVNNITIGVGITRVVYDSLRNIKRREENDQNSNVQIYWADGVWKAANKAKDLFASADTPDEALAKYRVLAKGRALAESCK